MVENSYNEVTERGEKMSERAELINNLFLHDK